MATDKQVKDVIDKFIDNLFNFEVLTKEKVEEKDKEVKKITTEDVYNKVVYIRPYVGVIQSITPRQVTYDSFTNNGTDIEAKLTLRKISYTTDNLTVPTDALSTCMVHMVERNGVLVIDYFDELQNILYGSYMENEHIFDEDVPVSTLVTLDLKENLNNYKHIQYMFKGNTDKNPFESKDIVPLDTYNLLYWMYKKRNVELKNPLTVNYFFTGKSFYTIFGKGHKYKVDIDKFKIGDILFFGRSDDNIGIYIGDKKFISLIGTFPKDNTSISTYELDDYWDDFNGRVMRFDEDDITWW
ncbi:tail protein with lysin activity [Staphylococcus phage Stau2]|uniref:Tail lysin n=2 Tax=Silviavirus TaxID=1857889 RepID=A0A0U2A0K4_9CAUD|nr:tail protein with lysin activity [Staphylococcus phage SA11]YP_009275801.1 tail protein with lysin activity [Staphylococcus phage Stau2]AFO70714.1 hypothetical protein [Staphylococcus phage SA11]AKA61295.1 tail lysin [Staphylococcus phage Stau2]UGL60723.1 tail lysin [Staphylococcus phage vB_SauM-HM01]